MLVRSNLYTSPGGDTTQIDMTAKYLRQLKLQVDIRLVTDTVQIESYDLLHFFNIIRPDDILPFINHNIPFVVSTIFVDYDDYEKNNRSGLAGRIFNQLSSGQIEYVKALARWIKNGDKIKSAYYFWNGHKKSIEKIVAKASMLLPNSHSEYSRLKAVTKNIGRYRKVVNAIETSVFNDSTEKNDAFTNHVLCVGRIEGRKNQLNLIKALITTELQLTIIGRPSPNHMAYYEQCKTLAATAGNIHFVEHISHENLVKIYKAAKVHVLPSWFETTGLSSLEAGVMGCNIVVTKKGDTTEYFGDMAYYCEPDNISSIREAVINAYNKPVNPELAKFILENYTWEKTAAQTLQAYQQVLSVVI